MYALCVGGRLVVHHLGLQIDGFWFGQEATNKECPQGKMGRTVGVKASDGLCCRFEYSIPQRQPTIYLRVRRLQF